MSTRPAGVGGLVAMAIAVGALAGDPAEVERAGALADSLLASATSGADSTRVAAALDSVAIDLASQWTQPAFAAAESLLVRSLRVRERLVGPRSLEVAASLDIIAALRFNAADYEGALPFRERCLDIRRERLPPGDPVLGATQRDMGATLTALGRYVEAGPLLETARAALETASPRDEVGYVNLLTTLGELRRIENRYAEAETCLTQALRIARVAFGNDPFTAYPMNNLAGVFKDQGRFDEAEFLLREALAIKEGAAEPDPESIANATLNLAELLRLQGRTDEAETLYRRALDLARGTMGPDNPRLVWFLNQFAVLYRDLERWTEAEQLFDEAREILERSGGDDPLLAQTLVDLAELLRLQGRHREAEEHARRSVSLREQLLGPGHPEVAMALLTVARCRAGVKDGSAEADALLQRAARILDEAPAYPEARAEAYAEKAELSAARGERAQAVRDMAVALGILEGLRSRRGGEDVRAGFLGGHTIRYEHMVRWSLEEGDTARAFEASEQSRARVFLDQLAASRVELGVGVPPEVRAPLEARAGEARLQVSGIQEQIAVTLARTDLARDEMRHRLEDLGRERDRWALEVQRSEEQLRRASPEWRQVATAAGRPVSPAELGRELLGPGELALIYEIGTEGSWVFSVGHGETSLVARDLIVEVAAAGDLGIPSGPLRSQDLQRVLLALNLGSNPSPGARGRPVIPPSGLGTGVVSRDRLLHALWSVLVPSALQPRLLRTPEVVVIPDGPLHALPFEALVLDLSAEGTPRYWLDAGPIVRYAPSATSLHGFERAPRATESHAPSSLPDSSRIGRGEGVLSVALPDVAGATPSPALAGRTFAPLPGTRHESEAVRDAFAPAPVEILLDRDATEPRVRAAIVTHRILHLATHGVVDHDRSGFLAGLVLTPATPPQSLEEDGFLQLFEIYGLRLTADLAVLSACETSAGIPVESEGVFALSRGFLVAGARRVVATLWPIDDEASAALVGAFFQRIAAGGEGAPGGVARSLRDAKRWCRSQPGWEDPYHWAPFVLTGAR